MARLTLIVFPDRLAICKLAPDADMPTWAAGPFLSVTRTGEELSIVCSESAVPLDVPCERNWRYLRVAGRLDFALTGVLTSLLTPLAQAEISVFALSTFETDYLLIPEKDFARGLQALRDQGHIAQDC